MVMIAQLLTELLAVESTACTVASAAEAAYGAAIKSGACDERLAGLNPGPHQIALGSIRTAIAHVETIMGNAADALDGGGAKS
jgi:hypothetical protein